MKKGNTKLEQLLQILDDETLCQQLLNADDNCSFLSDGMSKQYYLNEFERLLNSATFIMKKTHNFSYLPIAMKILTRFYLESMKENPFQFYENVACRNLLELSREYPKELESFEKFLKNIRFEEAADDVGRFYHKQMKKNRILNDFELKDLLNYLMIYKNRKMPHYYLKYLFYVIFEKDRELDLSSPMYAELFRFLILDLLGQLGWKETVHIVALDEKKPFIYQGPDIYINENVIKPTLEGNMLYFAYLFDLFEKRYKYKSFVHNKYEEIKSKKQYMIKEILGSSFFYENYSYLSIETEIADQSLISRLRFFEEVAPLLYKEIIEDYEKQIIEAIKKETPSTSANHLVLTLEDLTDQTILLSPEVIENRPFLKMEYHTDGRKKKIVELLEAYESELELIFDEEESEILARYYEQVIFHTSLTISKLSEEFIGILEYKPKLPRTDILIEKIIQEHFVKEINKSVRNHIITHSELETILSKFNEYMAKMYELEQKRISKYLSKNIEQWKFYNSHLEMLYRSVSYISNPELYESTYLNLTQVLDIKEAKEIQKKVLKSKLANQKIYMAVLVILILIFSISLFLLGRIVWQYWSASDMYGKIQNQSGQEKPLPIIKPDPNRTEFPINDDIPQVDFNPLYEINDEIVAWIRIDNTEINYPIARAEDNEYYLKHLYNKKLNISGSIFMDYRANQDFSSDNTILYGHNMRNNTMFGSLKKYKKESYFEEHKYIWFITPKATYQYEIYAAYEFDSAKENHVINFNSEESYQTYLDEIKAKSILSSKLEVGTKDHLLTLSTCTDDPNDKRFVVVAKRVMTYIVPDKSVSN